MIGIKITWPKPPKKSWWLFGRGVWFALPIELRRRWWDETDYGRKCPSLALMAAIGASWSGKWVQ